MFPSKKTFILYQTTKCPIIKQKPNSQFGFKPVYTGAQIQSLSRTLFKSENNLIDGEIPVWSSDLGKWVYSSDVTFGATTQRFYQDTPPAGNNGETFYIPLKTTGRLSQIRVRWDSPFNTDTAQIRFWRYRKVDGVFSYTQITDSITFNSTYDWSVWHDISDLIRDYDLDPDTDMVAVTNVYTQGASPTVRALNVTFTMVSSEISPDQSSITTVTSSASPVFPPV